MTPEHSKHTVRRMSRIGGIAPRALTQEGVPEVLGVRLLRDGSGGSGLWFGRGLGAVGDGVGQPPIGPTAHRVKPSNPQQLRPLVHPCQRPPLSLHPPKPERPQLWQRKRRCGAPAFFTSGVKTLYCTRAYIFTPEDDGRPC